jgi:hypothetical protein
MKIGRIFPAASIPRVLEGRTRLKMPNEISFDFSRECYFDRIGGLRVKSKEC